jgi:hypothetical protein
MNIGLCGNNLGFCGINVGFANQHSEPNKNLKIGHSFDMINSCGTLYDHDEHLAKASNAHFEPQYRSENLLKIHWLGWGRKPGKLI